MITRLPPELAEAAFAGMGCGGGGGVSVVGVTFQERHDEACWFLSNLLSYPEEGAPCTRYDILKQFVCRPGQQHSHIDVTQPGRSRVGLGEVIQRKVEGTISDASAWFVKCCWSLNPRSWNRIRGWTWVRLAFHLRFDISPVFCASSVDCIVSLRKRVERYLFDNSRAYLHLLILIVSRPLLERAATLNDTVILHVLVADEVPAFRVLQHSIDGPTRTVTFTLSSVISTCTHRSSSFIDVRSSTLLLR